MKQRTHHKIRKAEIISFMEKHSEAKITFEYNPLEAYYEVILEENLTIPQLHIDTLKSIAERNCTYEELNAVDYGIHAIQTLIDMGVIK